MRIGISLAINQLRLSGALWTPSDISTELWFDASDASTITESSGTVSQWDDKSGNDRHATQGSAGFKPATGGEMNGLNTIEFGGGSSRDLLYLPNFSIGNQTWIFVTRNTTDHPLVSLLGDDTATYVPIAGQPPNTNPNIMIVGGVSDPSGATQLYNGEGAQSVATKADCYEALDSTTGVIAIYNNVPSVTESNARIGNGTASNYYLHGDIAECICLAGNPSVGERQIIEGYLAWKWGIVASLPSDHPYKNHAPLSSTPSNRVDLFLLTGQSNAEGQGDSSTSTVTTNGLTLYNSIIGGCADPVGTASTGSMWPAFAKEWYARTGRNAIMIPSYQDGAGLTAVADTGFGNYSPTGALRAAAVTAMSDAKTWLSANTDYSIVTENILWCQGENDAAQINASNLTGAQYQAALEELADYWEANIAMDKMYVIRTGKRDDGAQLTAYQDLRDAQDDACAANDNLVMTFTGAVNFPDEGKMIDALHWDQDGLNEAGQGASSIVADEKGY